MRQTLAERIELNGKAASVAPSRNGQSNGTYRAPGPDEPWPDPVPMNAGATLPPFPTHLLPPDLGAWTSAVALALQVPPDLPGLLALAICGAGLAKRFRVVVRAGWKEPTNLFVVVALPPGDRKSAAFAEALAPVKDFEKARAEEMRPIIAEAASEHRQLEAQLKALEAKIGKPGKGDDVSTLKDKAKDVARQLATHKVPAVPQLVCDDVTPEALARLLAEQDGRMLQASPEGAPLEIAKGRYSESGKGVFEVYLKGHAGDDLRVNRVSRPADIVDSPALSVALAVQPDVLAGLAEQQSMSRRGFLARFGYAVPVSRVGSREIAAKPVPTAARDDYRRLVMHLWKLEADAAEPIILTFSAAADQVLQAFERWLEPQLAEGEELSYLAGWANKLAGACARIAGILHVAADRYPSTMIEADTVEAAVSLGRDYLLPHAMGAFRLLGANEQEEQARKLWEATARLASECNECSEGGVASPTGRRTSERSESSEGGGRIFRVSRRAIHQAVRTRKQFSTSEEVDPAIEILVDRYYLRPVEQSGAPGKGHKSPEYLINPKALALYLQEGRGRTHTTQNTHGKDEKQASGAPPEEGVAHSEHSERSQQGGASARHEPTRESRGAHSQHSEHSSEGGD